MKNIVKIVVTVTIILAILCLSSCVHFVPEGQPLAIRPYIQNLQGQDGLREVSETQTRTVKQLKGVNVTKKTPYYSGSVTATVGLVPARGSGITPERINLVEREISQMASKKLSDKGTLPQGEEYIPFAKRALSGMYDPHGTFFVKLEQKKNPVSIRTQTIFVPESEVPAEIRKMFPVN